MDLFLGPIVVNIRIWRWKKKENWWLNPDAEYQEYFLRIRKVQRNFEF